MKERANGRGRPREPSYWLFIPGLLAGAGVILGVAARRPGFETNLAAASRPVLVACAPWILGTLARLLRLRAASFFAGFVAGTYWVLTAAAAYGFAYFWPAVLPMAAIALGATVSLLRLDEGRRALLALTGFAAPWVILLVWFAGVRPYLDARDRGWGLAAAAERTRAHEAVLKAAACAHRYREAHPQEGFPASMALVGPSGTHCLAADDLPLTGSAFAPYHVSYEANRDSNGRRPGFRIIGERAQPHEHEFDVFSIDEAGLLRTAGFWTRPEGTPWRDTSAWKKDVVKVHLSEFANRLVDCLSGWLEEGPAGRTIPRADCLPRGAPEAPNIEAILEGYRVSYSSIADGQGTHGVDIMIRPEEYGQRGIRSYLVTLRAGRGERPRVTTHVTPEDRPATLADPRAVNCEIRDDSCAAW